MSPRCGDVPQPRHEHKNLVRRAGWRKEEDQVQTGSWRLPGPSGVQVVPPLRHHQKVWKPRGACERTACFREQQRGRNGLESMKTQLPVSETDTKYVDSAALCWPHALTADFRIHRNVPLTPASVCGVTVIQSISSLSLFHDCSERT